MDRTSDNRTIHKPDRNVKCRNPDVRILDVYCIFFCTQKTVLHIISCTSLHVLLWFELFRNPDGFKTSPVFRHLLKKFWFSYLELLGEFAGEVCEWLEAETFNGVLRSPVKGRSSGEHRLVCDNFSSRRILDLRDVTEFDDVIKSSLSASLKSSCCSSDLTWVFWKTYLADYDGPSFL